MAMDFENILEGLKDTGTFIGEKTADAITRAGSRTSEALEITAEKLKIRKYEAQVKSLYTQIGELAYENAALSEEDKNDITPLISLIDAKYTAIDECRKNIEEIKLYYAVKLCRDSEVELESWQADISEDDYANVDDYIAANGSDSDLDAEHETEESCEETSEKAEENEASTSTETE